MAKRKPTKTAKASRTAKAAPKASAKKPTPNKKTSAAIKPAKKSAATANSAPTKKPAAKKPAAKKPAAKKPASKKPAASRKKPTAKAASKPKAAELSGPLAINLLNETSEARRAHAIAPGAGAYTLDEQLGDVVAVEVAAEAAIEAGDLPLAIAIYTRLIDTSTAPLANHLIARGRAYYRAGDHLSAIGDFERGLAIEPHYPDLYFDKGKAELQAGRVGDAEASFTQDLELDPSPISFYNRHLARKALGDRDGALDDLDRAIEGMPDEIPLRVARSILRAAAGDIDGAFADADFAVKLDPFDVSLHDRCGRLALSLGRNERAAEAYATARRIAVDAGELPDAEYLAGEALAIGQLGRHADALSLLDRALAISPDDPTLCCNRGWMYHLAGRDSDALVDLDRALSIDPGYAKALQNRAAIYTALGDRSRALADYRRLDELGHDVTDAINRLVAP
jgi:tetratricopeptide (TPR) repeat protein